MFQHYLYKHLRMIIRFKESFLFLRNRGSNPLIELKIQGVSLKKKLDFYSEDYLTKAGQCLTPDQ